MTILDTIIETKRQEVAGAKKITPVESLKSRESVIRDFGPAVSGDSIRVIAEIKRKSPSRGEIRPDVDPLKIARSYEVNGAAALSILTDEPYFGGSLDFLREIRQEVNIPVLRKDFIIDEYQVWESYHAGADAILLILDALPYELAADLYKMASQLGLHVLVESYTRESLEHLVDLKPKIAGINARDLETMTIDLDGMIQKKADLPAGCITVAESGITGAHHLKRVAEAGFDAALIGTAFMQSEHPGATLKSYLEIVSSKRVVS